MTTFLFYRTKLIIKLLFEMDILDGDRSVSENIWAGNTKKQIGILSAGTRCLIEFIGNQNLLIRYNDSPEEDRLNAEFEITLSQILENAFEPEKMTKSANK